MNRKVFDKTRLFACAVLAAFTVSCGDDSKSDEDGMLVPDISTVCLSEINGSQDYIELYNSGNSKVSLTGAKIRRWRVNDGEDDKQTLWEGTTEVIEPHSYLCLRYEEGKEGTAYYLKRDFSARKNQYIWLQDVSQAEVSKFIRGEKSIGWNQIHMQKCTDTADVAYSFAMIDGAWVYGIPSPGSENGAPIGSIDQKMFPVVINEIDFANNRIELYNNSSTTVNIVGAELRWGRVKDSKDDNCTVWSALTATNIEPHGFLVVNLDNSMNDGKVNLSDFRTRNFHLRLRDSNGDGHKDFTGSRYVFDEIKRGKKNAGWGQDTLTTAILGNLVRVPDGTGDWESTEKPSMGSTNGTLHTGKTALDLEIDGY